MRANFSSAKAAGGQRAAFTLIELLMVIAIIGLLAAVGMPALKGFNKSNAVSAADRQMLDDIAAARQRAIAEHTDVYMLFMPPTNATFITANTAAFPAIDPATRQQVTNLLAMQYAGYALYAEHGVGDQPGQSSPRYLTPWIKLPDGMFIAASKFNSPSNVVNGISGFDTNSFPFPSVNSNSVAHRIMLPYLHFNYLGQLTPHRDRGNSAEVIPLARGSIMTNFNLAVDAMEIPRSNSITLSNHIRIDWLTGRAKVEQQQIQ